MTPRTRRVLILFLGVAFAGYLLSYGLVRRVILLDDRFLAVAYPGGERAVYTLIELYDRDGGGNRALSGKEGETPLRLDRISVLNVIDRSREPVTPGRRFFTILYHPVERMEVRYRLQRDAGG